MSDTGITIKPLHRARLSLGDGSTVEVEKIGKGRYTTAWANGTRVYLQTHEDDLSKEILSNLYDADKGQNPHLPACKLIGWMDGTAPYRLYSMPKYAKISAKATPRAWADFKLIMSMREDAWRWVCSTSPQGRRILAHDVNARLMEIAEGSPAVSENLREALRMLVDEACNYGEYVTEFRRANVATDEAGNLILLDPLFDLKELQDDHARRLKKARGY